MWGSKEGEEHSQGCCMCPLLSPSCSGCPAWQGGSVPCRCPYPSALLNVQGGVCGVCVCVRPSNCLPQDSKAFAGNSAVPNITEIPREPCRFRMMG